MPSLRHQGYLVWDGDFGVYIQDVHDTNMLWVDPLVVEGLLLDRRTMHICLLS